LNEFLIKLKNESGCTQKHISRTDPDILIYKKSELFRFPAGKALHAAVEHSTLLHYYICWRQVKTDIM